MADITWEEEFEPVLFDPVFLQEVQSELSQNCSHDLRHPKHLNGPKIGKAIGKIL